MPQREPSPHDRAFSAFERAHREDPETVTIDGVVVPRALDYHRRVLDWVLRLDPAAPADVRLAAGCQHIRRWSIPRDRFPQGSAGYKRWRSQLASFHGDQAAEILRETGHDDAMIARVRDLLLKKRLATDPGVQLLEDAVCLAFLERELAPFSAKHDDAKIVDILRKTWVKMTERGRQAARALLDRLDARSRGLVEAALEGSPQNR